MEGLAFIGILVLAAVYFVPAIVAHQRNVPTKGTVTIINIFLGWTFIGWVVSLAMAMGPTEAKKA